MIRFYFLPLKCSNFDITMVILIFILGLLLLYKIMTLIFHDSNPDCSLRNEQTEKTEVKSSNKSTNWIIDFTKIPESKINPNSFWGKLRQQVLERDNFTCTECSSKNKLTVHHKVPLSLGGKNTLNNLMTLCKTCHEKEHNNNFFDRLNKDDLDNYGKDVHLTNKVKIISKAIQQHQKVEMDYVGYKGEKSHRVIKPERIYYGEYENPRIYVYSYCFLRNETRTFRIAKMDNLKFVN